MNSQSPGEPGETSPNFAVAVRKEHKARKRATSKASIARREPLELGGRGTDGGGGGSSGGGGGSSFKQAWRRTAGELTPAEQRRAVEQALEVFRQLPPASSYAQHRIRVLEKALQLLDSERSAEQEDELQQLLSQLKL